MTLVNSRSWGWLGALSLAAAGAAMAAFWSANYALILFFWFALLVGIGAGAAGIALAYLRNGRGLVPSALGFFASLGVTAFVLVMAFVVAPRRMREFHERDCGRRLETLGQLVRLRSRDLPPATGPRLWRELDPKPGGGDLIEELAHCPFGGAYRGPAVDARAAEPSHPIACCRSEAHPDGRIHVLLRDGRVSWASPGEPLYDSALRTTAP